MLKQIKSIQGVGLFLDSGASPELDKIALFYGENGRGKSTLASILRACAENRTDLIQSRKTLDAEVGQFVQIALSVDKGAAVEALYDSAAHGGWTSSYSDLRVFDAEFVSRNVYSGAEINSDHRASLLEFALGEEAVELREKLDAATKQVQDVTGKIANQTGIVKALAGGTTTVDAFIKLAKAPNADADIEVLNKRVVAAQNRDVHLKRALPTIPDVPGFDAKAFFDILGRSLLDIEAGAEEAVRVHVERCKHPDIEGWLSSGQPFDAAEHCPYCGSSTEGNALIKAYQTYFNADYIALKRDVDKLERGLQRRLGDEVADAVSKSMALSQAQAQAWADFAKVIPFEFDDVGMKRKLAELREKLKPLLLAKAARPLERVGTAEDLAEAMAFWDGAVDFIRSAIQNIQKTNEAIEGFRKGLAQENITELGKAIAGLQLRKQRYSEATRKEVDELSRLTADKKKLAAEKEAVRSQLDTLMKATLDTYQKEINTLLVAFGSQARIDALKYDYRGSGVPRSDYRLRVRGQEVRLAGENGAAFGNTLSEGDKRALAFAFFVARLHRDPKLENRVVVIDDPMCSLDRRRRAETIRILKALAAQCKQLIVLAHDAYFLRDLDDAITKAKLKAGRSYCKVVTVEREYSSFGPLDLENECASQYEQDLATIVGFANAQAGYDALLAATRLRVLLESNLQRQFPHAIQSSQMLGQVIESIAKAAPPSPLTGLQNSVQELRALNDYAKQFHHSDDGAPPDFTVLDEGELRGFCHRALSFILRGTA